MRYGGELMMLQGGYYEALSGSLKFVDFPKILRFHQPVLDLLPTDSFDLSSPKGNAAFAKACSGLQEKWDGSIEKFPSLSTGLRDRANKAHWNAAVTSLFARGLSCLLSSPQLHQAPFDLLESHPTTTSFGRFSAPCDFFKSHIKLSQLLFIAHLAATIWGPIRCIRFWLRAIVSWFFNPIFAFDFYCRWAFPMHWKTREDAIILPTYQQAFALHQSILHRIYSRRH
eukprot:scaffold747_cov120-Cylindrotheca_fusiformis.AAC.26